MEIREATPADAEAVREIHAESIRGLGPGAYSEEQVEAWAAGCESADYTVGIESAENRFVVAEDGEELHGFGTLSFDAPEEYEASVDGEVTGVYVRPSSARNGVGSAILDDVERYARERGVRTLGLSASLNAVPFYEARGYDRIREHRREFSTSTGRSTSVEGTVVEMAKRL